MAKKNQTERENADLRAMLRAAYGVDDDALDDLIDDDANWSRSDEWIGARPGDDDSDDDDGDGDDDDDSDDDDDDDDGEPDPKPARKSGKSKGKGDDDSDGKPSRSGRRPRALRNKGDKSGKGGKPDPNKPDWKQIDEGDDSAFLEDYAAAEFGDD